MSIAWEPNPTAHEVNHYIQELDRQHSQIRYEQVVFDKQPDDPCLLCDLVLIAAIGAIGWLIWYGVARAI